MHQHMVMIGSLLHSISFGFAPAQSCQLNLSCMRRFAGWVMVKASAGFLSTSSDMLCNFCRSELIATADVTGC